LVADPDIGLVLRKTNLSRLEQVKAAFAPGADESLAMLAKDVNGSSVLTAYAPIEPAREHAARGGGPASVLGWKMFVEQPAAEVYASLDATVLRTLAMEIAGLLLSALAALYLARSMVRPIRTLQEGAQRIGSGDLDSQIEVRTGDELEALAAQFNRMTAQLRESYAGLERKVDERTAELKEALQQQTATSEVLRIISRSPSELTGVFEAILANATSLCEATYGVLWLREGDGFRMAALHGALPAAQWRVGMLVRPSPDVPLARVVETRKSVHILDMRTDHGYLSGAPLPVAAVQVAGMRTLLLVPMLKDDEVVGEVAIYRTEVRAFTERQIALIGNFADQAVIAIENVRLFNETKESLEQQTATSEILKVISSSTTDTQPVFEAIVQSGLKLFPDAAVVVTRPEGGEVHLAAIANIEQIEQWKNRFPFPLTREYMHGVAMLERRLVDVPDAQANTDPSLAPGIANFIASGARAITVMPMVRGDAAIGAISVVRQNPGPLGEKQIALLRTFADQAVIAIENVRLFNETKEALEQQTATSEVLKVISRTTFDLQPVLQIVLDNARKLCDADRGTIFRPDAEGRYLPLAFSTDPAMAPGQPLDEAIRREPIRADRSSATGRA